MHRAAPRRLLLNIILAVVWLQGCAPQQAGAPDQNIAANTGAVAPTATVAADDRRDVTADLDHPALRAPLSVPGELLVPENATGIVLFARGNGSCRENPLDQFVAQHLQDAAIGTLLFDLLTPGEHIKDAATNYWSFDISLLTRRLLRATGWLAEQACARNLALGYFGSGTGAAAALVAGSELGLDIEAIVSCCGRPDLAGNAVDRLGSPTLFIVGEDDRRGLSLNRKAFKRLTGEKQLAEVPNATHLFEEPGALREMAGLTAAWFHAHFKPIERS